eukprot:gene38526-10301_t
MALYGARGALHAAYARDRPLHAEQFLLWAMRNTTMVPSIDAAMVYTPDVNGSKKADKKLVLGYWG